MKHKYNVGDSVVYIDYFSEHHAHCFQTYIIGGYNKETKITKGTYFMKNLGVNDDFLEEDLYTKAEALEFITNYINKTEE